MPALPPPRPVFVYGTLRPGQANHDPLLRGRISGWRPAVLPGAVLLHGPGYPYALDAGPGERVRGELVSPLPHVAPALLADLDRLEEYVPGDPASPYERVARRVLPDDGPPVTAWVYLAGPAIRARLAVNGRRVPGDRWPPTGPAAGPRPAT